MTSRDAPIRLAALHRRDFDAEVARGRLPRRARSGRSPATARTPIAPSMATMDLTFAWRALASVRSGIFGAGRNRQASAALPTTR